MKPYNFTNLTQTGGVKSKLQNNINAVKLLRQLEQSQRFPTEIERDILAKFTGWGTVASVINREVLELLPNTDLNSDNAFQTPRFIIEAVWEILEQLGFKSGRIADPAANIGLWAGFQNPEYRTNSEWLLVEIDPTAKAIAQYLHPDAIVYGSNAQQQIGFEHTDIPKDSFDLVVSNFPFGVTPPFDPKYQKVVKTLHNYFWAKSLALTTPGGIIASITSVGTMDSTPEFCQYLASQGARLIGAVRLPNTAFKSMNTSVTADLIILQKMTEPQNTLNLGEINALNWGEVVDSPIKDRYNVPLKINRYFAENPDKVLGELTKCVLYAGERIAVAGDSHNLKQRIIDAFSNIEPCYTPPKHVKSLSHKHVKSLSQNLLPAEFVGLDPYRYVSREGKIYQYRPGEGLCLITQHTERITAGLRLKQTLDNLIQAEIKETSNCEMKKQGAGGQGAGEKELLENGNLCKGDKEISTSPRTNPYSKKPTPSLPTPLPLCEFWRSELNRLYQEFVKCYGELLNRRKRPSTLSVFSDDSELTTLCYALEEEIPADVDLKEGKVKGVRYKKADIFTTRISGNLRKRDRKITSPIDAVYDCLDRKGYLDLKFIALLLDKTEEDTIAILKAVEIPNHKAGETANLKAGETGNLKAVEIPNHKTGETGNLKAGETGNLKAGETANLKTGETANLKAGETANLKTGETGNLKAGETANLKTGETANLKTGETGNIKAGETGNIKAGETANLNAIEIGNLKAGETTNLKAGETTNLKALETTNLKALETTNLKALETTNLKALETTNLKVRETGNLKVGETGNLKALETGNLKVGETGNLKVGEITNHKVGETGNFNAEETTNLNAIETANLKTIETPNNKQSFIFYDIQLQRWVTRDEYLSGDTRAKLQICRTCKDINPEAYNKFWLYDNETQLTKKDEIGKYLHLSPYLLPPASETIRAEIAHRLKANSDIDSHLESTTYIDGSLGVPWVESEQIAQFIAKILHSTQREVRVCHVPELGLWSVTGKASCREAAIKSEYAANRSDGKGNRDVFWLIEQTLNQSPIKIQVFDNETLDRKASTEATDIAIAQIERLKKEFKEWLWSDIERAYHLTVKYNKLYPLPQKRIFDGSYLSLPDSNTKIQLKPHQLNGIARAIQTKRLLTLWEVGTGKSYQIFASAYESQRLGIAQKPIIVALNSTLSQMVAGFRNLYPNVKLLVIDDNIAGRSTGNWQERNKLIAKIQTGRYDAILLTHTQFFSIPISNQTKLHYIREQLELVERYLAEAKGDKSTRSLGRELRRQQESLHQQIDELEVMEKVNLTDANSREFQELVLDLLAEETLTVNASGCLEYVKSSKRNKSKQSQSQEAQFPDSQLYQETESKEIQVTDSQFYQETQSQETESKEIQVTDSQLYQETQSQETQFADSQLYQETESKLSQFADSQLYQETKSKLSQFADSQLCQESQFNDRKLCEDTQNKETQVTDSQLYLKTQNEETQFPDSQLYQETQNEETQFPDSQLYQETESKETRFVDSQLYQETESKETRFVDSQPYQEAKSKQTQVTDSQLYQENQSQLTQVSDSQLCQEAKRKQTQVTDSQTYQKTQSQEPQIPDNQISQKTQTKPTQIPHRQLSQKQRDKKRDSLNNSLERATQYYTRNSVAINWEDLGCQWVWFDEIHAAKNIPFASKAQGIAGITNVDTQRSLNTLLKYRFMFDKGYFIGGGTGTLPSNSLTEVFNMMRLFCPDLLHSTQTEHFDSWLGQYGEITTSLEFTSTGGIKSKTRVASFKNLWELMSSLSLFTDFVTADSAKIERPILHRHTITAPMNGTQLAITQNIKHWMERWQRKQPVSYCKADGTLVAHNPLTLTSLGSLSSIDSRLVEPNAVVHKETKLHQLIHNVLWIYRATDERLGTQIIFSDSGVPKGIKRGEFNVENSDVSKGIKPGEIDVENSGVPKGIKRGEINVENSGVPKGIKRGEINVENSDVSKAIKCSKFDVYNYIKDTLVALGIPANQIAFIHEFDTEAKRLKLYDNVNRGRIRILLGSTLKAGTGINVQRLCIALHHLDLSWTPANLIQRRGRGHRQGNLWPEIWEFTYGTSGLDNSPGFDAYKANLVRLKAEMSYRIMSGNVRERHCEDVGEDASHFLMAAAILSGNSAALDHAKITSKIRQKEADLVNQQTALGKSLYALKNLAQDRMDLEAELTAASDDLAKVMAAGELKGEGFRCEVQGIKYDSVEQAGNALIQVIYRIIQAKEACFDYEIGEIAGLRICVTYIGGDSVHYVRLRGAEFMGNSGKQNTFYHLGNWNTGRGLISCLRDTLKDIKGENNSGITIAENLAKKLEQFNRDAERLPEMVSRLTQVVSGIKAELAPLKVEEFRLRHELVKASEGEDILDASELSEISTASEDEDVSKISIASAGEDVSEISIASAGEDASEISTVSAGEDASEISTASGGKDAEKLQVIDYTEEDLVPAPGAALYFGSDADIVEYILSLGEPTTVDEEGNLVTWIDKMESLKLKLDVANLASIEEAKQQLEKTLELKTEEKGKSNSPSFTTPSFPAPSPTTPSSPAPSPTTPYSPLPTPFHIQEIRRIIGAIGLSEESLNRVMANLTIRIQEELGLLKLDGENYLWETVGLVQQGRLF